MTIYLVAQTIGVYCVLVSKLRFAAVWLTLEQCAHYWSTHRTIHVACQESVLLICPWKWWKICLQIFFWPSLDSSAYVPCSVVVGFQPSLPWSCLQALTFCTPRHSRQCHAWFFSNSRRVLCCCWLSATKHWWFHDFAPISIILTYFKSTASLW